MKYDITFKNNGKLKLLITVGTRPEIIRLSEVIKKCRKHFDCVLAHTGQNYDYTLNGIFFEDLNLDVPDVYLNCVGDNLGQTVGNIIASSYELMEEIKPDALLILGDTNSCLSAIGAKRLHIPIFHMEAGNRCKDECLPEETNRRIVDIISDVNIAYSEHARRYLADCGLPKERTYVSGSPMAEVLDANIDKILNSDILSKLGLEEKKYILLSAHREENIDTDKNFRSLFNALNSLAEKYDMVFCGENYHDVFPREKLSRWKQPGLCYFDTMSGWEEWLNMTPEEHYNWTTHVSQECIEIEILELIKLAASGKKVIVDTNIPPDVLREISDYNHVAILLCDPPDICATRFFDRDDPDKKFMMEQL